jgi:hypothetical protein
VNRKGAMKRSRLLGEARGDLGLVAHAALSEDRGDLVLVEDDVADLEAFHA